MLKAKQNSFLKWFIGIVLLMVSLCSFMTTAFAAPDGWVTCSICGKGFGYGITSSNRYETVYSVPSLNGLTNSSMSYHEANSNGDSVDVALYNNKEICLSCLENKIAEYKASTLNATVPASLPIHVGEDGKVTTASNASITNNGSKPIEVSSINITASSGWTVQSKADATNATAGSKVIAIGFNNAWATPNGGNTSGSVNTSGFDRIPTSGTLALTYDAVIPKAMEPETANETAATATIVVSLPEAPTMAAKKSWYKPTSGSDTITKITFMGSYTPTETVESWNVDAEDKGDIKCYKTGTELIIAGNGTGKIRANADSSFMFNNFSKLTTIENLGLLDTSQVTNMSYIFMGCSKLAGLDVSGFDTTNVTTMNNMFYNCSGLTSLDASNFNTAKVTTMVSMFSGCSGLTSLDASGFDITNVTSMNNMFYGCSGLTSLDASKWNTSNVTDMSYMFAACSRLKTLDASKWNTSNVTNMSHLFAGCSGLTTLNVLNWNTTNVTNMSGMFNDCSGLTSFDISNFNTSEVTDMSYMFGYCRALTTIYAGDGWNTDKVTSSEYMFYNSRKLPNYNNSKFDVTMATFTSNGGYLTHKAATKSLKLNVDQSGTVNGYTEQSAA